MIDADSALIVFDYTHIFSKIYSLINTTASAKSPLLLARRMILPLSMLFIMTKALPLNALRAVD